jgi:hypothetical protein
MQVNISRLSAESPDIQDQVTSHPVTSEFPAVDYSRPRVDEHSRLEMTYGHADVSEVDASTIHADAPLIASETIIATESSADLIHTLQLQVERQAKYQALIRRVTMAIQNSTDLPEILKIAAEGTAQVLNADQGMVLRMKFWDPRHSVRCKVGTFACSRSFTGPRRECQSQPKSGPKWSYSWSVLLDFRLWYLSERYDRWIKTPHL